MNEKGSELVNFLNKNNEEIYGEAVAKFISVSALHYGLLKAIAEAFDKSTSPGKNPLFQ